jgi:hypothetical protein
MRKIDLVLQGPANNYTLEIANHYLKLEFVNNIIISCWESDNVETNNNRIIIIKSVDVANPGSGNRNRHIKSSLEGLKIVNTEFSVKLRSDQKISLESMHLMYNFYEKNKERELMFYNDEQKPKNKICVAGIFKPFPFHPRDHIFWGNTEDLIDVFNIPYSPSTFGYEDYNKIVRSEAYIAAYYYAKFDETIQKFINNPQLYLVDNAPKISEAFEVNDKIITKVFQPFPKIDFEWPKHNLKEYHYDFTEKVFGEFWGTNE